MKDNPVAVLAPESERHRYDLSRAAADQIVSGALFPVGIGLVALFFLFSVANFFLLEPQARVPMALLELASALIMAAMVVWVRATLPRRNAHAVAFVGVGIAMTTSAARIWLTANPAFSGPLILSILGVGLVFLDVRWAVLATMTGVALWGVVAVLALPAGSLAIDSFTISGAAVLSFMILGLRRRIYGRLDFSQAQTIEKARALDESESKYQLALMGSSDGLYDWDLSDDELTLSDRLNEMLAIPPAVEPKHSRKVWADRIHPDDAQRVQDHLLRHLKGEDAFFEDEFRIQAGSDPIWVLVRGASIRDASGRVLRMAGSVTDMSRRGVFDPLTGLPNRRLLLDRLDRLRQRPRNLGAENGSALLFIDLNGFKQINDTFGHQAGDDLLRRVASRLQSCVRASDTVARLGGDEFIVLLDNVAIPEGVEVTLNRIRGSLAKPHEFGGRSLQVPPSVGIVLDAEHYLDSEELLRDADSAMYQAKHSAVDVVFFDVEMRARLASRLELEMDLRVALDERQFLLDFQSIVSLKDGAIEGYEALVRWHHPVRGRIGPADFIPITEKTGLIIPLGEWVILEACRRMMETFGATAGPMPYVSINLSGRQLAYDGLVPTVEAILSDTGFPPDRLRLEITESAIVENPTRAAARLLQLRNLGIRILMDDFGTGHSSLSYLRSLPIDTLKIDQSFIRKMLSDSHTAELVRTIIQMSENLGLTIIAEGIETPEEAAALQGMACASGQGYLFSRPCPLAASSREPEPEGAVATL